MSKLTVARALTARFARRIITLATIIASVIVFVLFLIIWALAHFFSAWWWLLLVPVIIVGFVFIIVRLLLSFIVSRIHSEKITKQQSDALDALIEKVEQAIEARATPPPIIVMICVKDLVVHRDVTTVKKIINDTIGLRREYQELENLFV